MTMSDVHISLDSQTIDCTPEEIAGVFAGLLREMRAAAPFLTDSDRVALRLIMSHDPGTLTVAEVFPGFTRGSDSHYALRRLRTAQFIRPAGRDMWDRESLIDTKPFARLAWDRLGEAGIFGDASETVAEATEPAVEEIDLALPEVDEPSKPDTIRTKNTGAAAWDDNDVLDYLKDETKG